MRSKKAKSQPEELIDDVRFQQLINHIASITAKYQLPYKSPGSLMHHQYATEYDNVLTKYNLTKPQFIEEVNRRLNQRRSV